MLLELGHVLKKVERNWNGILVKVEKMRILKMSATELIMQMNGLTDNQLNYLCRKK